jgi:uncharacterized protein YndB with AHSA1/START domain
MIALYVLGVIVALFGILTIAAPTDFKMEREVVINKPKDEVFTYLKSLKNQDNWSTWNMKDPNMKRDYRGTDNTVGFVAAWDSQDKNVGKGEQEIKKITEGERIDFELRFEKPMKATNNAFLITKSLGPNQTAVTWGFSGESKRPMNVMTMFMKGMLRKAFDDGLANLKKNLEK